MVKILGVCGSPRKAATEYALRQALDAASQVPGVEVELVTLRGKKLTFVSTVISALGKMQTVA